MSNQEFQFGGQLTSDGGHLFPVRIYYEDTDFTGNVYHAAYLKFFERARTEFLRARNVDHQTLLAEDGVAFAVRSINIDYEKAARIDDVLEVSTSVKELRGPKLILEQELRRNGEMITRAQVVVVTIKPDGRPTRLPQRLRKAFE